MTETNAVCARPIGAVAVSARSLAPDLARGAMLLLTALANSHLYLYGHAIGVRGYPLPESIPDQMVVLLQMVFVDGRAYPMFAFLFATASSSCCGGTPAWVSTRWRSARSSAGGVGG